MRRYRGERYRSQTLPGARKLVSKSSTCEAEGSLRQISTTSIAMATGRRHRRARQAATPTPRETAPCVPMSRAASLRCVEAFGPVSQECSGPRCGFCVGRLLRSARFTPVAARTVPERFSRCRHCALSGERERVASTQFLVEPDPPRPVATPSSALRGGRVQQLKSSRHHETWQSLRTRWGSGLVIVR